MAGKASKPSSSRPLDDEEQKMVTKTKKLDRKKKKRSSCDDEKEALPVASSSPKKKKRKVHGDDEDEDMVDLPLPGFATKTKLEDDSGTNGDWVLYSTKCSESLIKIADKLGISNWQQIAEEPQNKDRYGVLKGTSVFLLGTILFIPPSCTYSQWALQQILMPNSDGGSEDADDRFEKCCDCRLRSNPAQMLVCDGCDRPHHVACVGLDNVPKGDWFCSNCMDILKARKGFLTISKRAALNLRHRLPSFPRVSMDPSLKRELDAQRMLLRKYMETKKQRSQVFQFLGYGNRKPPPEYLPLYLGRIMLTDTADVVAMQMLREPQKLIVLVPVSVDAGRNGDGDVNHIGSFLRRFEPRMNQCYAVFATLELFDKTRDDDLPMVVNGVRDAQRRLFRLLNSPVDSGDIRHPVYKSNQDLVVSSPLCPPSVKPRCTKQCSNIANDETSASPATKYFELCELVQDCNNDLDVPREPTPTTMLSRGLTLYDYQQCSLRWMLDKEREATGLGLAGQLWHRLRFLDPNPPQRDFFYCDLTGSFALDIFDFQSDSGQQNAAPDRFSKPTGGILGEEMGLGKTAIAIALIVSNPPPLHHRMLPREHDLLFQRKKSKIYHPSYVKPPILDCGKIILSNATLVIVPINISSQWQKELKRFAPELTVELLHTVRNPTVQSMAQADVVIAATTLLHGQSGSGGTIALARRIKKIHWYRIVVDEAHQQGQGSAISKTIASLSATHRHSLSGTPLGASLEDLHGQLHVLRLPPFCRPKFWEQNIARPYKENNHEALRVVRSMLSHVVCRHSKDQKHSTGKALLALSTRNVETILLPFGSEDERRFYGILESFSRAVLRATKELPAANSMAILNNLLLQSRHACCHVGLNSLQKLDRLKTSFTNLYMPKNDRPTTGKKKTRGGILSFAAKRAYPGCRNRMINVITLHQGNGEEAGELLECNVCLEDTDESGIAVLPCAHPICQKCVSDLLSSSNNETNTREARALCPSCREPFQEKSVTFLGEAEEALMENRGTDDDMKLKGTVDPTFTELTCFQVSTKDVCLETTGADSTRADFQTYSQRELAALVDKGRANMTTLDDIDKSLIQTYYQAESKIGTKIAHLLLEVREMIENDETSKCVIFSQHTYMLQAASLELKARGIQCCGIFGNMKQHERADTLNEFSSNPNMKAILLSMRGGAAGLNLTCANVCFILDVAQNAAMEEQAIDRIHRIGQTRPVLVKRFVMKDTVEERLTALRRTLLVDKPLAGTAVSCNNTKNEEEKTPLEKIEQLFGGVGSGRG